MFDIKDGILIKYLGSDKNVIIPDNVTSINNHAFFNCDFIESVTIPNSVTFIDDFVFEKCTSLKSVTMLNSLISINQSLFLECTALESITIPNTVVFIDEFAFYKCSSLKSIVIPNSVTSIRKQAFYECSSLKSIVIPNTVTFIANDAFLECMNIENIELQHSKKEFKKFFKKIFNIPFRYNPNMKNVSENIVDCWSEENKISYRLTQLLYWENLTNEQREIVEDNIKNDEYLRSAIFKQCEIKCLLIYFKLGLTLDLEDIEEYLSHSIKNEETEITAILLNYKNENFTKDEIENYEQIRELTELGLEFPTIRQLKIKWEIYEYDDNSIILKKYKGNNKVEIIPLKTKEGKMILIKYSLSNNYAISLSENFGSLEKLILSNGEELYTDYCYNVYGITEFNEDDFPYGLRNISCNAFMDFRSLKKIVFPNTITNIHYMAFECCDNLESITIPNSVYNVNEIILRHCENLVEINIQNTPHTSKFLIEKAFGEKIVKLIKYYD